MIFPVAAVLAVGEENLNRTVFQRLGCATGEERRVAADIGRGHACFDELQRIPVRTALIGEKQIARSTRGDSETEIEANALTLLALTCNIGSASAFDDHLRILSSVCEGPSRRDEHE